MCGGGPTGITFVDDAIDKADNWTEAAGDQLAEIDPGPAIGDAGEYIDKSIIQPMAQDPVGSIATIAAIATQQYYLLPYIAAANTALKGGKIEDIALSFGVAYVAAYAAPGVSEWAGGGVGGAVVAGTTVGAGSGAATALARGEDVGEAALRGGIVGGVTAGVSEGYAAGKNYLLNGPAPTIGAGTQAGDFGVNYNKVGTGEFGVQPTAPTGSTEFGVTAPTSSAVTPLNANYSVLPATELGILTPPRDFGIKPEKYGTGEFGIDPTKTDGYGIKAPTTEASPQYVVGSSTNTLEDLAKKTATKAITGSILENIYGTPVEPEDSITYTLRRRGGYAPDQVDTGIADTNLNLAAVNPDKFELRKFANPEGRSTLISFKDNKPQQPIPTGFEEVETIGAAEGGLISTNMVKYSKKPLVAPRKPELTKKKKTTRKGLAGKQS